MYYVYFLKSEKLDWYYVGMTSNIDLPLSQHNHGYVTSTKSRRPYNLVFKKEFGSIIEARDYEKYLKIRSNKEKIIKTL